MQGSLTKTLGTTAAMIAIFAVTFAALFVRSRGVFIQVLASVPHVQPVQKVDEDKQFYYWNFRTSEINKLITELATEREALVRRQEALAAQEALVASARQENERLRAEIARARDELTAYIVEIKAGEAAQLRSQVAVYGNMSAESIVGFFAVKRDEDVVKILALMKPDFVAQIFEAMRGQPTGPDGRSADKRICDLMDLYTRIRQQGTR